MSEDKKKEIHIEKALFKTPDTPDGAAEMGCLIYFNQGEEEPTERQKKVLDKRGFRYKELANDKHCFFSFEENKAYELARLFKTELKRQPVNFVWYLAKEDIEGMNMKWADRYWNDKNKQARWEKFHPPKK